MAALSAAALAGGLGLQACEVAAFNPATLDWLGTLATAIGANVIADGINSAFSSAWDSWTGGVRRSASSQTDFGFVLNNVWAHSVPPVVLVGLTKQAAADPMNDALVACVAGGSAAVVFENWAWQALSMFTNKITAGKSGDDLARAQELCLLGVIPSGAAPSSGQTPQGSLAWLSYSARNGSVEIAKLLGADGSATVEVTSSGIPVAGGGPTIERFTLPTAPQQ